MKLIIVSTEVITTYNGAKARIWTGTTESGVHCTLYVAGVQVSANETPGDIAQFERQLQETAEPRELREVFDMRMF